MVGSKKLVSKSQALGTSLAFALIAALFGTNAAAQDPLRVSIWGGSWKDFVAENVGKHGNSLP